MSLCEKEKCTGCMACYNICSHKAIKMKSNNEGFLYPGIDKLKCVNCHLCEKVCPQINQIILVEKYEKKVFAAWQKSKAILKKSTSGGAFSAFAKVILNRSGAVYGAGFDANLKVVHKRINNIKSLSELRGSKYVQSEIGDTFKQVKRDLDNGLLVLYSGTPCQIDALYSFLSKKYVGKLYTIDLVCHGVPSPLVYKEYLKYMSKKYNSKISDIYFRYKKPGWFVFGMKILFENGKIYENDTYHDPFIRGFLREYFLRPSCHDCQYTNINRPADITLADFWGYKETSFQDQDNDQGISMVMINNENGENLFNLSKNNLKAFHRTLEDAVQGNQALKNVFPLTKIENSFGMILEIVLLTILSRNICMKRTLHLGPYID